MAAAVDAFLTKLNPSGSALLYSTYLGGTGDDIGFGVAVDASGNAYVTGQTTSTDFPVSTTRFQGASGGGTDAFVAKLNPTASGAASLVYSTYLGGSGDDGANGIVVDAAGNATIVGRTDSTNFPMGAGTPFQNANGGGFDVFVARLGPAGSTLLYATYLGGSGEDRGFSIARDASNNVYITGRTLSTNFPTTAGAFDTGCGSDGTCNFGLKDAYVAKLNPAAAGAASLVYSTYLGGSRDEEGVGIAVDGSGRAHVTGWTDSTDFPTANAFQPICGMGCGTGFVDAFVTRLNAAGSALEFSTYLGGSSSDYGIGIFADAAGNTYLTGESFSDNFPTVNPLDRNLGRELRRLRGQDRQHDHLGGPLARHGGFAGPRDRRASLDLHAHRDQQRAQSRNGCEAHRSNARCQSHRGLHHGQPGHMHSRERFLLPRAAVRPRLAGHRRPRDGHDRRHRWSRRDDHQCRRRGIQRVRPQRREQCGDA